MWPWRKRSPFEKLGLPKKVFISHSYRDAEARERLLALLPPSVEPFIFPPVTVPPEQMVSDKLLDAIRESNGLIYLQGGASAQSFWVALERDYAIRTGKPVFVFDPSSCTIMRDKSLALSPNVFMSYRRMDNQIVRMLTDELRKRYFDVFIDIEALSPGSDIKATVLGEIRRRIQLGGYIVSISSRHSWDLSLRGSEQVRRELDVADNMAPDRIIFAVVDPVPGPQDMGVAWKDAMVVQIYGDSERSMMQRVDDLIVRLYWLIYRNTRQNQLS